LQYSLYALQQRVERYTAQRARLASKSVEGDMVGLLTLSAEQRITFDELLQSAVSEVYAVTSGYARPLPIRGCIVNEGVPISVFSNSASGSFAKGSYIRITSSADSVGAIYLSLADGAQGSQVGNPAQWEVQPEYVDTSERVTLLLAEDRRIGVWGIQALEVIYRLIADQLYYHILAQWYAMCAMPDDAARAALSADDKRASLVIALDAARLEVEKESFF
jgi:hypothetical protein